MASSKCLTLVGRFVQKEYQNKVQGHFRLAKDKTAFLSKKSPLGEDDGYLTDDVSEEVERHFINNESSGTHSALNPRRQLLWYIDRLIQDGRPSGLKFNNSFLPTVLKMHHTIGEERCEWFNTKFWPSFGGQWGILNEDVAEKEQLKEGTRLMCAMILYQVFIYLRDSQKKGYTMTFREDDKRTYKFKPDDLSKCIWHCLCGDQEIISGPTIIDDAFLLQVLEKWKSGQTLLSSIVRE